MVWRIKIIYHPIQIQPFLVPSHPLISSVPMYLSSHKLVCMCLIWYNNENGRLTDLWPLISQLSAHTGNPLTPAPTIILTFVDSFLFHINSCPAQYNQWLLIIIIYHEILSRCTFPSWWIKEAKVWWFDLPTTRGVDWSIYVSNSGQESIRV